MKTQNELDMYKTLGRLEETRAAFFSRSDDRIFINFRLAHGNDPKPFETAALVEKYFLTLGVRCVDFPAHADRMSGHLVLEFKAPFLKGRN